MFALKQIQGARSHSFLSKLAAADAQVREFAMRALADRDNEDKIIVTLKKGARGKAAA